MERLLISSRIVYLIYISFDHLERFLDTFLDKQKKALKGSASHHKQMNTLHGRSGLNLNISNLVGVGMKR
jgi:hypothetical protein